MKDKPSWIIGLGLIAVAVVAGFAGRFSTTADDPRAAPPPPTPTSSAHALGATPVALPGHATLAIATVSCR